MSSTIGIPVIEGSGYRTQFPVAEELRQLEDGEELAEGCGMFRILDKKHGDKRVVWNRMNLPEIRSAKKMFDDLVEEGLVPYRVGPGGARTNSVMQEFDATAEEVVFAPVQLAVGG